MTSPVCTVKDGAGVAVSTASAFAPVTPAATVTIALADTAGVRSWSISCVYADETTTPATITAALVVNGTTKTATFTAPAAGKSLIFLSAIVDQFGEASSATFKIATATAGGKYVIATNETTEHSSVSGYTGLLNDIVRTGGGGSGFVAATDLTGTSISQTVARVNGTSYAAGGALTTGNIPRVTGVATVAYGPIDPTLPASFAITSEAHGDIFIRGASGWKRLAPSTGKVLSSAGAGADPIWVDQTGINAYSGATAYVAGTPLQSSNALVVARASSTGQSPANQTYFKPAMGLGWYDVTLFGATGDGTTDDTVAIQNCIDAAASTFQAATVYFPNPPGSSYRTTGPLTIFGDDRVKSNGFGGTTTGRQGNIRLLGSNPSSDASGGCMIVLDHPDYTMWLPSVTYTVGQRVAHNNKIWQSVGTNLNKIPKLLDFNYNRPYYRDDRVRIQVEPYVASYTYLTYQTTRNLYFYPGLSVCRYDIGDGNGPVLWRKTSAAAAGTTPAVGANWDKPWGNVRDAAYKCTVAAGLMSVGYDPTTSLGGVNWIADTMPTEWTAVDASVDLGTCNWTAGAYPIAFGTTLISNVVYSSVEYEVDADVITINGGTTTQTPGTGYHWKRKQKLVEPVIKAFARGMTYQGLSLTAKAGKVAFAGVLVTQSGMHVGNSAAGGGAADYITRNTFMNLRVGPDYNPGLGIVFAGIAMGADPNNWVDGISYPNNGSDICTYFDCQFNGTGTVGPYGWVGENFMTYGFYSPSKNNAFDHSFIRCKFGSCKNGIFMNGGNFNATHVGFSLLWDVFNPAWGPYPYDTSPGGSSAGSRPANPDTGFAIKILAPSAPCRVDGVDGENVPGLLYVRAFGTTDDPPITLTSIRVDCIDTYRADKVYNGGSSCSRMLDVNYAGTVEVSGSRIFTGLPPYAAGQTYYRNDAVIGAGNVVYKCIIATTASVTGQAPPNVTYWSTPYASAYALPCSDQFRFLVTGGSLEVRNCVLPTPRWWETNYLHGRANAVIRSIGNRCYDLEHPTLCGAAAVRNDKSFRLNHISNQNDMIFRDTNGNLQAIIYTAAYTAAGGDFCRCDTVAGAFTVTLPMAAEGNRSERITIKKISADANTLTIGTSVALNIDGATSVSTIALTAKGDVRTFISNGTTWDLV